ncbi:hypothetical protein [Planobispora rosea]|uniref:hypothetical protein n=1 Tax=Planobispora rosea TaxID=35762 RepID=UPI000A9D9C66|nr:hypothetical protein [Planobispora rosea]
MTATAWPEGVIARYLTVGGATVDVSEMSSYYDRTDPTSSVAICLGCDKREVIEWTQSLWSYSENDYVEVTDEGGEYSTPKVREWAQAHAEKCRSMPKPE